MSNRYGNKQRARRAMKACTYLDGAADEMDDLDASIMDLITDLMHLAHRRHVSVESLLATANLYFRSEIEEEEDRCP